ncbi:uncharacterized protein EAF01_001721 [Botrytis porri]|uniref:ABC transporter domain-containing protein n=1 Tax=Botrytis porri TaxID=87229 RepID=A0A4Z1KUV5_9HELO|nr:uncharacterized protein EAF01_001721 [Botrytis porri]KAF7912700.1 hypothetical protein EAF01_001721 [Botrytis porri]TGO88308.1 hypothetical protein BPOR_0171g00120 [Botrytis porri]
MGVRFHLNTILPTTECEFTRLETLEYLSAKSGSLRIDNTTLNVSVDQARLKKIIGYVPPDDVMLHLDDLLSCLGLSHSQNILVGDPSEPVISGGQQKRVSIGIKLAAAPLAIMLDEPTSGPDATSTVSTIGPVRKALCRPDIIFINFYSWPLDKEIYFA